MGGSFDGFLTISAITKSTGTKVSVQGPFYTKNARFHTTKNHSLLDGKKLCLSQTS